MTWAPYIEQRPEVMMGKPVIKGTCITVELLLEQMSDGASEKDLLEMFPHLSADAIRAAVAYAASG